MAGRAELVPTEHIFQSIALIRGQKVLLDRDLASMYGVSTSNLNKAVRRNKDRFPKDFCFQLTPDEWSNLRFQFGMSKSKEHGGRRYAPYVFTEQGVAMLSSVLKSKQAKLHVLQNFTRKRQIAELTAAGCERLSPVTETVRADTLESAKVERGRYLVNASLCNDCHTLFIGLKDVERPCRRSGCKGTWTDKRGAQLARNSRARRGALFRNRDYPIDKIKSIKNRCHPIFQQHVDLRLRKKSPQRKQRRRCQDGVTNRPQPDHQDALHFRPVPTRGRERLRLRRLLIGESQVTNAR